MAGLGLVPSGSIVSRTPCRMSPSSWKLVSFARSGSIHASMNCLDRSSDAASLLSLSLALLLSLDPRGPVTVPPTAGLEYRERVALVVGGAVMAATPGVPGAGSPPLLLDVLPRGPAALLLAASVVCACEHHPICIISNYFGADSEEVLVYFSVCSSVRAQSRTVWVGSLVLQRVPGGGDAALGTECLERRFEI